MMNDIDNDFHQIKVQALTKLKEEYMKSAITARFFFAFQSKYPWLSKEEEGTSIFDFVSRHVSRLVENKDDDGMDAEFQDHLFAFVSSYVYDFEIIDEGAIADFIMRRYNEYKILYIDQGVDEKTAWRACFRDGEIGSGESVDEGLIYEGALDREMLADDAIEHIHNYIDYFQLYTTLSPEKLREVLAGLFAKDNEAFLSLFANEFPQVVVECGKNEYKLSVPNLIMACVGLFLNWQSKHVILDEGSPD